MDDQSSVDLVASTGNGDSNSPWNGLLQTALQAGVSAGTTALNSALQKQTPLAVSSGAPVIAAATPTAAAPAAAPSSSHTLLYVVGGLALAVVAWLLLRKS